MQDLKPSYIKTFANDDLELSTEDLSVLMAVRYKNYLMPVFNLKRKRLQL